MPFVLMPDWNEEEWKPCRDAWDARGFAFPPTTPQRALMWPVVREFSDVVEEWIAEAPYEGDTSYAVVGYVLEKAGAERERESMFLALTDEERQEWFDLEQHAPRATTISRDLLRARTKGTGLPPTPDGGNP